MYEVTQCSWGSKYDGGRSKLRAMAHDAIIAEMADVLEGRARGERELEGIRGMNFQHGISAWAE
ncbi:MAG: hypothetical protein AAB847_00625 [Patescibacteria group bacterium]